MRIMDVKELIRIQVKKGDNPQKVIFSMVGHTGIGKTSICKQVAKEEGVNFLALYLAVNDSTGDLIGVSRGENGETVFYPPSWLTRLKGKTILLLDEINRAPEELIQFMYPLLTERLVGYYKLPDDVILITAENPDDSNEGYQVNSFDPALIDRLTRIKVETSLDDFVEYSSNKGLITKINDFIAVHPEYLESNIQDEAIYPSKVTPRGLEACSDIIKMLGEDYPNLPEVLAGKVGLAPAIQLVKALNEKEIGFIKAEEIFDGSTPIEKIATQSMDRIRMTLDSVVKFMEKHPVAFKKEMRAGQFKKVFNSLSNEHKSYLADLIINNQVLTDLFKAPIYSDLVNVLYTFLKK